MIALLQRVQHAYVNVNSETVGEIGPGLLIFLGVFKNDTFSDANFLANKCANLRIFEDETCKMNKSLLEIEGSSLVVSQFTLCADVSKGRRPNFMNAAIPEDGEKLYNTFVQLISQKDIHTETGIFGATMDVVLINDGPVTLILNSHNKQNIA